MKQKHHHLFMIIAAAITIFGIATGKFLFLLIMVPFGFEMFRRKKDVDE